MLNVHAAGGAAMLSAARAAVDAAAAEQGGPKPLLIAVTVLTSLGDADLRDTGMDGTAAQQALRLARLTAANGLDGVVCSAQEAPALRAALGPRFKLVTPGIRPAGSAQDDQSRIITPQAAIANGADYLVIGRPITQAKDPVAALAAINASLGAARMKITMIGTGYVGLVTGTCLAEVGNDVLCLDVDARKIEILNQGGVPIHEPGLEAMIARNVAAGRLRFTTDQDAAVAHGALQFIAVGTPPDEDGSADMQYVLAAARNIGRRMTEFKIVVDKSTVPVGTADRVRAAIAEELRSRGVDTPYAVVSNPEFLKEGAAVEDFMRPDRVVIGADDERAIAMMRAVYAPFQRNHERLLVMDVRSAELTKYAANAMLATRISFMNELANLADALGADIEHVRQGIGSDPRIGWQFLYPGVGYGGSCFPKDVKALQHTATELGRPLQILGAVEAGERSAEAAARREDRRAARRGSRRAPLRAVGARLQAEHRRHARGAVARDHRGARGARRRASSPTIRSRCRRRGAFSATLRTSRYAATPMDALAGADALIVVTEWKEFRSPDFDALRAALKQPLVFDGRNLYEPALVRAAGLEYFSIGRP